MAGQGTTIGATLRLDGEREYKQALTAINAGLKVNQTELQRLAEAYRNNGNSVQALSDKEKALQGLVLSQTEKVNKLKEAMANSARQYGEGSRKTLEWQASLNRAEAELLKMQRQLEENQSALEEVSDGGERFRAALEQIEAASARHTEQMASLTQLYGANSQNVEYLAAKQKLLKRELSDGTKRVEALEGALESAQRRTGETSEETKKYQRELLKAREGLTSTEAALRETEQSLSRAEKGTSSLGDKVRGLASVCGLEIPPALNGVVEKLDGISSSGAALVGVLGGVVAGLVKCTLSTTESAKQISVVSQKMGMTTDAYQEWDYVLRQCNSTMEEAQGDLSQLAEKALDAKNGGEDAAQAFQQLHVKVTAAGGKLKSQEQLFNEVVAGLQNITDETKRNAIASDLLSTTGENLVPVLNMTKQELAGLKEEAHTMGTVISESSIQKFNQLDTAMKKAAQAGQALKNNFAEALLPILTGLFEAFSKIPVPVLKTAVTLIGVVTAVVLIIKTIKDLTGTASAILGFMGVVNPTMLQTTAVILGIAAAIIAVIALIALLTKGSSEIERTFSSINGSVGSLTSSVQNARSSYGNIPAYAKGTSNHPGGLALVGENGPEIVNLPKGSRVYPHGQGPSGGGNTYNYIFKVDDISTYAQIEKRLKIERQSMRMGLA